MTFAELSKAEVAALLILCSAPWGELEAILDTFQDEVVPATMDEIISRVSLAVTDYLY